MKAMQRDGRPVKLGEQKIEAQRFVCDSCKAREIVYSFVPGPGPHPVYLRRSGLKELLALTDDALETQP
jgi:hypothetical protein